MTRDTCELTRHPKIEAINHALRGGRHPGVVAAQYKLDKALVSNHHEHLKSGEHCGDAALDAMTAGERAFREVKEPGIIRPLRALEELPHAPKMSIPNYRMQGAIADESEMLADDHVPSYGEAYRQDQAERMFRQGWSGMNRQRREKNAEWLQQEVEAMLQADEMGL